MRPPLALSGHPIPRRLSSQRGTASPALGRCQQYASAGADTRSPGRPRRL